MANATISFDPTLYVRGLSVSNNATTPNTKIDISAGSCRDSSNVYDIISSASITLDASVNGVNGLDTGTFAASKMYAVYMIADQTQMSNGELQRPALVMSLSLTGPLMPSSSTANYGVWRLIGFASSNGSTQFHRFYTCGTGNTRIFKYQSLTQVLNAGAATTLTAIDLSAVVPAVDKTPVTLNVSFTPNAAGNKVSFTPYGSTATLIDAISGVVASQPQIGELSVVATLNTAAPTILYINSAATGSTTAYVSAFTFYL